MPKLNKRVLAITFETFPVGYLVEYVTFSHLVRRRCRLSLLNCGHGRLCPRRAAYPVALLSSD